MKNTEVEKIHYSSLQVVVADKVSFGLRVLEAICLCFESRCACDTGSKSSRLIADELIELFLLFTACPHIDFLW